MHRYLIPKLVGAVALLTALGGGTAYAFTASNTVPGSNAGEGAGAVSGYTVYNISYTGLNGVANLGPTFPLSGADVSIGNTGSPTYLGSPVVNGLSEQDGITTVSFQLSPDNATWAAVQLYNAGGAVIGGGGASNCGESGGVWTCNVRSTEGYTAISPDNGTVYPVPMSEIAYLDVEAALYEGGPVVKG
jgi:hypothetical protein